ncbi:S1C family serine protease [Arthrobacter halodurans]|uniref:S1C family serine protease n=1 Tax=Arthrobacter halodurans TaxID=516699 RepID=A0ABV4UR77_9MICC
MSDQRNTPGEDAGAGLPPRPQTPPKAPSDPYSSWNSTQPIGAPGPNYPSYGTPDPRDPSSAPASAFGPSPAAYRRQPKRFGAPVLLAGMLAAALVGGGAAVGANQLIVGGAQPIAVSSAAAGESVVINNPENVTAVTAAAAKASPSVVTIEVNDGEQGGSGSGIILDDDGHILTNTHVVTLGGATASPNVSVRTSDGAVHEATIVGTDPLSDLAVIKIEAGNLTPATLGESGKLNVGDTAIAIGAPLGLSGTVTDGIVSTLNRTISVASSAVPDDTAEGQPEEEEGGDQFNFQFPGEQGQAGGTGSIYVNVLQTDAAINHGNSGGALVDIEGRIIGVNVAIASSGSSSEGGSIGVGFAIPIDYAQRIANDLIADGKATHGLLGVTVQAKPADTGESRTSFSVGAEIRDVAPDSPAAQAGLQSGDVITGVGDRPIDDSLSLTAAVREYAAGTKATIHYTRGGEAASVEVTVAASPEG